MASEAEPPWLDDLEARAWMGYRRMKGLLNLQLSRDLSADSGLSDADYDVLSTLGETPGEDWRLRELAERLRWSRSRLAHQLARMARRDLIERESAANDPRGASIVLSERGREVIASAAPEHVRSVRRHFIDALSRDQLAALAEVTETVLSRLVDEHDGPGVHTPGPRGR